MMSPGSKKEYIEAIFLRYKKAPYHQRTIILDEFCATCGYHRKHAIRILRSFKRFVKPKGRKRGSSPVYQQDLILKPLKQIWLAANLPCSKRLKAILPLWLPGYVQSFGHFPSEVSQALLSISAGCFIPSESNIKPEAEPPPNPEPLSENISPSKPTNGTNLAPGSSKPTRSLIGANLYPECLSIPLTALTLPLAGVNKEPSGKKGKLMSSNKSNRSKNLYPFPCSALIATMAASFSMITS